MPRNEFLLKPQRAHKFLPFETGPNIHWFHQGCGGRLTQHEQVWTCEACGDKGIPDREWYEDEGYNNPTTITFGDNTIEVCMLLLPESGQSQVDIDHAGKIIFLEDETDTPIQ